jgi:DUF4097 and DUF4098 domain-containing protein YvlB
MSGDEEKGRKQVTRALKFAAAVLLMLPLAAVAQDSRVYRDGGGWTRAMTGSVAAARNLRVNVDIGSVTIHGGTQPGISYVVHNRSFASSEERARREFDSYHITAFVKGDTAYLVAEWQGGSPHKFQADFTVNVPRNIEYAKLETNGGSIETTAIAGRLEAESGGGSIHLDDIGGTVNAETGGGSIEVGTTGSDLNLRTGGGSIEIRNARGKINAETGGGSIVVQSGQQGAIIQTGGGSIQVRQCNGKVKVSTGGGSIDLGDIAGPAEIDTGGGSIHLTSAKGPVRAETGSGSIELFGVPGARAETGAGGITAKFIAADTEFTESLLETSAGDIIVYLAPNLHMDVRASIELANGHEIRSDFPGIHITTEGGDYGPRTVTAEGSLNGGGPVLKVRTTTGDIVFRRSK